MMMMRLWSLEGGASTATVRTRAARASGRSPAEVDDFRDGGSGGGGSVAQAAFPP